MRYSLFHLHYQTMEGFIYPVLSLNCWNASHQTHSLSYYCFLIAEFWMVLQLLISLGAATFTDYTESIFIPYLSMQLQNTNRLDVFYGTHTVWKNQLQKKGVKVSAQASIPGKWMDFLYDSKNKTELFAFLTNHISKFTFNKFMLHLDNLFYKGVPQIAWQTVITRKQTQGL